MARTSRHSSGSLRVRGSAGGGAESSTAAMVLSRLSMTGHRQQAAIRRPDGIRNTWNQAGFGERVPRVGRVGFQFAA
ncbi:hypothetical protein [Actinoplanes sp. NPDC051411]|uniref:hypothetical protein n=1 Tax=Actinoplanes sp. NPDC051411 TaxID=3155522 RepID=UPI003435D96A